MEIDIKQLINEKIKQEVYNIVKENAEDASNRAFQEVMAQAPKIYNDVMNEIDYVVEGTRLIVTFRKN